MITCQPDNTIISLYFCCFLICNVTDKVFRELSGSFKSSISIPPQIFELSNLVNLVLARNQLSGSIPDSIKYASKLEKLDLSYNQLTGPVPSGIQFLNSLQELDLNNNIFSGPFPNLISTNLQSL